MAANQFSGSTSRDPLTIPGKRAGHASWRVPGGVLLLGGWGSPRTVDLLTDGGTVQRNPFLLKYPIK